MQKSFEYAGSFCRLHFQFLHLNTSKVVMITCWLMVIILVTNLKGYPHRLSERSLASNCKSIPLLFSVHSS